MTSQDRSTSSRLWSFVVGVVSSSVIIGILAMCAFVLDLVQFGRDVASDESADAFQSTAIAQQETAIAQRDFIITQQSQDISDAASIVETLAVPSLEDGTRQALAVELEAVLDVTPRQIGALPTATALFEVPGTTLVSTFEFGEAPLWEKLYGELGTSGGLLTVIAEPGTSVLNLVQFPEYQWQNTRIVVDLAPLGHGVNGCNIQGTNPCLVHGSGGSSSVRISSAMGLA